MTGQNGNGTSKAVGCAILIVVALATVVPLGVMLWRLALGL